MNVQIKPCTLQGEIGGITSKSFAHRALICAALAKGESEIQIDDFSQDISATVECLVSMGASIKIKDNICQVSPIKTTNKNIKMNCRESGSTLRFLLPVICALGLNATVFGEGRLPERPLSPLKEELLKAGAIISDEFPLRVKGKINAGDYKIKGDVSSQFVSGLLFALSLLYADSTLTLLPPIESRPYIDITLCVLRDFGANIKEENNRFYIKGKTMKGRKYVTESDWSNAAFWLCSGVGVKGLNLNSPQGDKKILEILAQMGANIIKQKGTIKAELSNLKGIEIDVRDIPDLVPVLSVLAATAKGETKFINAGRLRLKESDRLESVCEMLKNLGADAKIKEDSLIINGKDSLDGGSVDSFGDHRIVMSAAILATKSKSNIIIKNAHAVEKSYPEFFTHFVELGGNVNVL